MGWYYAKQNQKVGPISEKDLMNLKSSGDVSENTLIWAKGFENWKKMGEVDIFTGDDGEIPPLVQKEFDWESIDKDSRLFSIKSEKSQYGPYSIKQLKNFFDEKRINGKTLIFAVGMDNWRFFAETPFFKEMPDSSQKEERRKNARRPFVARILFHNNAAIFEGICQDISINGLQILVADFPGKVGDKITLNVHPDNSDYNFTASGKIIRFLG